MSAIVLICATLALGDGDSGWCHRKGAESVEIRLAGADAGEVAPYRRCQRQPRIWACSPIAREFGPIAGRRARQLGASGGRCTITGRDQYRREVVICTVNGRDLGGQLVREGLAISATNYGDRYAAEQRAAQQEKRGVWR
ncbi:thermonuclease family protein [Brevundimonas olei]|uniref:thermonuclease family protein n=1 Tax=Brevundimonas olei TaxID=657642 RepID=UPI003BAFE25A